IRPQPLGSLNDLGIGVAAVALNDEFAVTDRGRDGVGGSWDGELCRGTRHRASQGWCGSSLIIRPLASDSTLPSESVIVALTTIFRPSTESIHARDTSGSISGKVPGTPGSRNTRGRRVLLQSRTDAFDQLGRVV